MNNYRQLEERLIWLRWVNRGHEAPGEEDLLEEMAEVWMLLEEEEQELIRREGPKSLIASANESRSHHHLQEPISTLGPHRVRKEAA